MSWQHLPFDQTAVAQSDKGRRIKQRDYLPTGAIPVIDQGREAIGGYTDDVAMTFGGELPVILFGDHTRAVKLVSQRFAVGADGIKIFRPADGVRPKYLYYWMKSAPIPDRGYSRHYQYLRQLIVPVPSPSAQDGIVAEIEKQFSRLDEAVAGLKRVKANLKRYKAAILKAAVEGRLVPTEADLAHREGRDYETGAQLLQRILDTRRNQWQGKGSYKDPTALDAPDLPDLPDGWCWATLDQIAQEGRSIIYGIIKPGPHDPNGIPYVRVTEMKDGTIDVVELKRAAPARAAKFARATLAAGDVLISKDGTIGRVAVVPPELAGGNITQHVMRAPIHEAMCRDYVVWAIRSDTCQHWLTGETKGVALRGVNVEDFRRLPIPIPPYSEQHRIVAEVDRMLSIAREAEAEVETNLKRAQALRQSILGAAFSG